MGVPLLDLVAQYQSIKDEVVPALMQVIERQSFIMGPEVGLLEEAIGKRHQAAHAIACASGTDAILLPLMTLRMQPGDEVIAPAFTFFATAGAIHNAGGTPVFVEIDPATFCISADAVAAAITPRTRAIVVVHLYGQMAEMARIMALAATHGLMVIEDGAQSIGARQLVHGSWRTSGTIGTAGTLSFFPSKNLGGWGDGGMMLTNDEALGARLRKLRVHGGAKQYHHEEVGINSRLDTVQAAVLLVKLAHLDDWNTRRRARAARYLAAFTAHPAICPPRTAEGNEHIYHQYTIRVDDRDGLKAHLTAKGIGCAVYYPTALHLQPCFAHLGYRAGSMPITEAASAQVISLPIYPELTDAQQDTVIDAVTSYYA